MSQKSKKNERPCSIIGDKEDIEEIYRRYEAGDPVARFLLDHAAEVEEAPRSRLDKR